MLVRVVLNALAVVDKLSLASSILKPEFEFRICCTVIRIEGWLAPELLYTLKIVWCGVL